MVNALYAVQCTLLMMFAVNTSLQYERSTAVVAQQYLCGLGKSVGVTITGPEECTRRVVPSCEATTFLWKGEMEVG